MNGRSHQHGRPAAHANTCSFGVPAVLPFAPGMQPPPQDAKRLRRELTRINWALHCLHGVRSKLVVLLDRKDLQVNELRRQRDAYACALQDMDPEAYASAELERLDWDDPIRALRWSQRQGGTDDVL